MKINHLQQNKKTRPIKLSLSSLLWPWYIDNKERSVTEKKSQIRAMYYGNMAGQLQAAGVSTTIWQALMCRRIKRIMMHRQKKYLTGQQSSYTTLRWPQHHLRGACVSLPDVQWRKKGNKESRSSRD